MKEFLDYFKNKKNLTTSLLLLIMILGIHLGRGVLEQQIIRSRAAEDPIKFAGDNVRQKSDGTWVAKSPQISLELTSPLGGAGTSGGNSPSSSSTPTTPPSSPTAPPSSQPTTTLPTGSLIRQGSGNVAVGQEVTLTATGLAGTGRTLKGIDVFVARKPDAGESGFNYVRVDNCPLGFNSQTQGNNGNWCYLLNRATNGTNTIKFTPNRAGTYRFIMGVYDNNNDSLSSQCSSNYGNYPANNTGIEGRKYSITGPGVTHYYQCDPSGRDFVEFTAAVST